MKKILAILLACAMLTAMFAGCGSSAASGAEASAPAEASAASAEAPAEEPAAEPAAATGDFTWNGQKEVWSILPTTNAEGLVWINDAMGATMEASGFTYVKKDAQGDPSKQVSFVEDAIAAGNVGALMVAAMDVDMLKDVIGQATAAGIAVAYLGAEPTDYTIGGCVYTAYEITGMYAVEAAEDWAEKRVAEGGNVPTNADGKFEVACDVYTDIKDGVYRSNAIVGTVDASDKLVRVATTSSYAEGYNKANANATDVLGANPDCHIFIAYEPQLAMGMSDAIADYCEQNGLDMADYCVIACYGEDDTFKAMYEEAQANPAANAIKGYSTYGDPPIPFEAADGALGTASAPIQEFAKNLTPDSPVIIPPILTGEHLAEILLGVCGVEGYSWNYGETYYDTITVTNTFGYDKSWSMGEENPAIQYKDAKYIG